MRRLIAILSIGFFLTASLFSQKPKQQEVRMTLKDCIVKTLKDNLDISIDAYDPGISELAVKEAREKYWPQIEFKLQNNHHKQLSNWYVEGEEFTSKTNIYSLNISQKIVTGADVSFSLSNSITDTTQSLMIINPTYAGRLQMTFTQPLLKGFGSKVVNKDIHTAEYQRNIADLGLRSKIIAKIYDVEAAYWNLVSALEELKVKESFLENNKKQLEDDKKLQKIGLKTTIDIVKAEAAAMSMEDSVRAARLQAKIRENELKKIINFPENENMETTINLIPTDRPQTEESILPFQEALNIAYNNRPEMETSEREIENSELNVQYYKNQCLPELNLQGFVWFPGQSGDILIYKDNNPYSGVVVGKIEGGMADSLKDVFGFKYGNWQIWLNLTIPLDTIFSRAKLAKSKMENEKKLMELERQKKNIYYELLDVYEEMENNKKQIENKKKVRQLQEKQLEIERERYALGLTDIDWIFKYQDDLINAIVAEKSAIAGYRLSVAKWEKLTALNIKKFE